MDMPDFHCNMLTLFENIYGSPPDENSDAEQILMGLL